LYRDAAHLAVIVQQLQRLAVGQQLCPGGECLWDEGALHRLFVAGGKWTGAVVVLLAARHFGVLPAHALDPFTEKLGAARQLRPFEIRYR